MNIELKRLHEVSYADIVDLMNSPLIRKHMPLASDKFGAEEYDKFITAKEEIWCEFGYGPWAFFVNEKFVGWGGLQPMHDEIEVALMLSPKYWGMGKKLYEIIIQYAFETLRLQSVIILFPPSRRHVKGVFRLGFKKEDEIMVEGAPFIRYRLKA